MDGLEGWGLIVHRREERSVCQEDLWSPQGKEDREMKGHCRWSVCSRSGDEAGADSGG